LPNVIDKVLATANGNAIANTTATAIAIANAASIVELCR
jgi:hypothetical protein